MKTFISLAIFLIPFLSGIFIPLGVYSEHKIIFSTLGYIGILLTAVMYVLIVKGMDSDDKV